MPCYASRRSPPCIRRGRRHLVTNHRSRPFERPNNHGRIGMRPVSIVSARVSIGAARTPEMSSLVAMEPTGIDPVTSCLQSPTEDEPTRGRDRSERGSIFNGAADLRWPTFQPAKVAHFSTGLDNAAGLGAIGLGLGSGIALLPKTPGSSPLGRSVPVSSTTAHRPGPGVRSEISGRSVRRLKLNGRLVTRRGSAPQLVIGSEPRRFPSRRTADQRARHRGARRRLRQCRISRALQARRPMQGQGASCWIPSRRHGAARLAELHDVRISLIWGADRAVPARGITEMAGSR
jgi:hypothetical protein